MRKFPVLILLTVLFAGCRENYLAEKAFWWANRDLKKITAEQLQSRGPEVFDGVIPKFEAIVDRYTGTPTAVDCLFVVSNLKIQQKKLEDARSALERIVRDYPSYQNRVAEARFGIGAIYETQGLWDKAEQSYWDVAYYSPSQFKGLYAPIYVLQHYVKAKDETGKQNAYTKALDHYEKLVKQSGPIQAAAGFKNYLALTHYTVQNWDAAIKEWKSISADFKDSPFAPMSLLAVCEVYARTNEPDKALANYNEFLQRYPKHPMVPNALLRIAAIHVQKKEYDKALEIYEKLIKDYAGKQPERIAQMKMTVANVYRLQGNWDLAEKTYREIQTAYPDTTAALNIPFVIAAHLEQAGDKDKAKALIGEHIKNLQKIADSSDNDGMRNYAKRLINAGYMQMGDWSTILSNIDHDMEVETVPVRKGSWLFLKALITQNRLGDTLLADKLYREFLEQYPDHPLAKQLAEKRPELVPAGVANQ